MKKAPTPTNQDLCVFSIVARRASFAAAATELGVSAAYITKRIRILERELGAKLLHRSTRGVMVTEIGKRVYQWAQRILDDVDQLIEEVSVIRNEPSGLLRISSSFGFGRRIVAPAISKLVEHYPSLQIRFEVYDRIVDIIEEDIDLDIRVGDEIAPTLIARKLACNHRILCASPDYLARRGTPHHLKDLSNHDCLTIKERDQPLGVWRLRSGKREYTAKVAGPLSSNNGEIATQWAVDGHGILLRSVWDIGPLLRTGKLVQILPDFVQEANVWAVYPVRLETSAKIRACVELLQEAWSAP